MFFPMLETVLQMFLGIVTLQKQVTESPSKICQYTALIYYDLFRGQHGTTICG